MPLSNLFEDDLLDAIFTNTPPRMRKATYSILSTPEDYERAQRRAQNNNRTPSITNLKPGLALTFGTSSSGPN